MRGWLRCIRRSGQWPREKCHFSIGAARCTIAAGDEAARDAHDGSRTALGPRKTSGRLASVFLAARCCSHLSDPCPQSLVSRLLSTYRFVRHRSTGIRSVRPYVIGLVVAIHPIRLSIPSVCPQMYDKTSTHTTMAMYQLAILLLLTVLQRENSQISNASETRRFYTTQT